MCSGVEVEGMEGAKARFEVRAHKRMFIGSLALEA